MRPADILDPDCELSHMERFSLDLEVANSRSSEGEKTKTLSEVNKYLTTIQDKRKKTIGGAIP